MLKNKKILLAVCGSIAFYKAYEILRELRKNGADVYVALSDGALKFCSESGFDALCEHKVLSSRTENWQDGLNHIAYAKVDLILIAPASVNTINRLANGICDNVFMQTLIASNAPVLIAPAANDKMISHFSTQKSFSYLKSCGVNFIEPVIKTLACGDTGKGGLAEISTIIHATKKALCEQKFKNQKIVISAGATTEKIDDVRAITNFSSGKMGKALAYAFYYAGANVCLVASFDLADAPFDVVKFQSSNELKTALENKLQNAQMLVMAAAVSDYVPSENFKGKLKKQDLTELWQLNLVQNVDILSSLSKFNNVKKIGFKLETDKNTALQNAKNMLKNKSLDAVCLNVIGEKNGFGSEQNEISFIRKNGEISELNLDSKDQIAMQIVNLAAAL